MNREELRNIVDATVKNDDERLAEAVKAVMLEKIQERLGYKKITEAGNVKIQNNDVFVSGKKVGSVNLEDDSPVVEFTDTDGKTKEFDDIDEFHRHLARVFEGAPEHSVSVKDKALKKGKAKSNAGDGEEGEYTSHDPRSSKHKDERMEKPSKHDHGNDDKSGVDFKKANKSSGSNPEDKEHNLDSLHKDDRMETPKGHDHGHNDKSGVTPSSNKGTSGSNPPDKDYDPRNSAHKDSRMENPKKHDHGHDSNTKDV